MRREPWHFANSWRNPQASRTRKAWLVGPEFVASEFAGRFPVHHRGAPKDEGNEFTLTIGLGFGEDVLEL